MRLLSFFIICVFLTTACDRPPSGHKRPARSHLVEIVTLEQSPLISKKTVIGSLAAPRTVQIYNEELGKIRKITVHPGDHVNKGTILIELNNKIIHAEHAKALATHKQAVLDYKRIKKLKPRRLASEEQITRAETTVAQTRAELALQQARLSHTHIRAPFNGLISERFKEPGDIVPLHSHILTIYDPTLLIARVNISEIILHSIKLKHKVGLRIDALGDSEITGTIIRKHPLINAATRQGTIEIKLDQVPDGAFPGQLVRVNIEGQTKPLLNLPLHVVRHDTRGEFVYRISNKGKAEYISVKTGIQLGDRIEITEGLTLNDRLVSKGFLKLRNNSLVKIKGTEDKNNNMGIKEKETVLQNTAAGPKENMNASAMQKNKSSTANHRN